MSNEARELGQECTRRVDAGRLRGYSVALVEDLVQSGYRQLGELVAGRSALVVTTPTVEGLYARSAFHSLRQVNPRTDLLVLDCSESSKSPETLLGICRRAAENGLDRKGLLIGIGGGVCTDLVTLAASLIRRGVDYVKVPTTLVGQVDAGIGVKGAVNFAGRKSFLGCFAPPLHVMIDPEFLSTLPLRLVRCGFAEILKVALARDAELLVLVERYWSGVDRPPAESPAALRDIVWRSTLGLLAELEANLYEDRSPERLADLGHTFSPALETSSGHSLHHGEAVAIDIALSAVLATQLGLLRSADQERILGVLRAVGLPLWHPLLTEELCWSSLNEAAVHRAGRPNLVLPVAIGAATFVREIEAIAARDLRASLAALRGAVDQEAAGSARSPA